MTSLQKLYDVFQTKVDEDLTGKESLIFALVDTAISKSYKTCRHDLSYTLDDPEYDEEGNQTNEYEGNFNEDLDKDELELLALWMAYEWKRRKVSKLEGQRETIGTTDFNKLENRANMLKELKAGMKDLMDEIIALKNEFNTYSY